MTSTLAWPAKIRVRQSVCDVIDVAVSAQRTRLLVYSPRPIFRGKGDTWVDLADTAPPTQAEINRDARIRSDLPTKRPNPCAQSARRNRPGSSKASWSRSRNGWDRLSQWPYPSSGSWSGSKARTTRQAAAPWHPLANQFVAWQWRRLPPH